MVPTDERGDLRLDEMERLFGPKTKLVSVAHVSNVLGTVNPVDRIVAMAHAHGVPVMVDGAQSAPHFKVDVRSMDCDFFVLSGHKMYGPTGIGVLYGKESWLDRLPPYQGGGEMIESVSFEKTVFERLPFKFEAGTPDYIATHGLAKAIEYIGQIGIDDIAAHERELTRYCMEQLRTPYFLVEEKSLLHNLEILKRVQEEAGCKILLAQKAFSMFYAYPLIRKYLTGTTASGLYEARLGHECFGGETHVFSPAYREEEFEEILQYADDLVFNSPRQVRLYGERAKKAGK